MTEFIETPLTVLHAICCLFLILVVLLQPGKGGGLGALSGAGAQQVFGGRGAGNFLTKTTWVSATVFFLTSASLAYLSTSTDTSLKEKAAQYDTRGRGHLPPSAQQPPKAPEKGPAEAPAKK